VRAANAPCFANFNFLNLLIRRTPFDGDFRIPGPDHSLKLSYDRIRTASPNREQWARILVDPIRAPIAGPQFGQPGLKFIQVEPERSQCLAVLRVSRISVELP
jgi:hypothetical protein